MSEIHQQQQQQQLLFHQPRASANSRFGGVRSGGGEIVEVQGGHIVRSTGRKDRHSKVCTAKGPRDRRVRLSANTAIQFYDVQDRLGYDRPSKAVDWLIKHAKAAIDELAELPPWHPTATPITTISEPSPPEIEDSSKKVTVHMGESAASSAFAFGGSSSFLPPSLESDAIADTIKFFFPIASGGVGGAITTSAAPSSSNPTGFHHYPPDLLSRSNSHAQDLRLSLQSFQDPNLLQHHSPHSPAAAHHHTVAEQAFFDTTSANWSDQNSRIPQWGTSDTGSGSSTTTITAVGGSYMFSMPQPQGAPIPLHPVLGQGPFLTQRGPLQSNNSPSILAWTDPTAAVAAMQHAVISSSTGFASGGFSGFHIPARIQGEEEHHDDVMSGKPSSTAPRR